MMYQTQTKSYDPDDEDYTYEPVRTQEHDVTPWPEIVSMRQDSAEQRIAQLEQRIRQLERVVHRYINADAIGYADA